MNDLENFKESEWNRLLKSVAGGHCAVILGPDMMALGEQGKDVSQKLAAAITEKYKLESVVASDQLAHVVDTYLQRGGKRYELEDFITDFYSGQVADDPSFFDQLAALPFIIYLTTTHDNFLLSALEKNQEKVPQLGYYDAHRGAESDLAPPTSTNPILYQLFGKLDKPDSLILSENDLLNFIQNIVASSPGLAHQVEGVLRDKETTFLFVGFGFSQWYVRILLHTLLGRDGRDPPSTVLESDQFYSHPDSEQSIAYFHNRHSFGFYRYPAREFVAELLQRYQAGREEVPAQEMDQPPKDAPRVFLSYRRTELDEVSALRERLMRHGINVWQDVDKLRGGDRWENAVIDVISKQVDLFVLLQTPSLVNAKESVVFDELVEAKKRDKRWNPDILERFIIPVKLQQCEGLQDIGDLNFVDLTEENGFNDLVAAIKRGA